MKLFRVVIETDTRREWWITAKDAESAAKYISFRADKGFTLKVSEVSRSGMFFKKGGKKGVELRQEYTCRISGLLKHYEKEVKKKGLSPEPAKFVEWVSKIPTMERYMQKIQKAERESLSWTGFYQNLTWAIKEIRPTKLQEVEV